VTDPPQRIGRYVLYDAFAAGGMATVHAAQALGDGNFSRIVAVKRLHAQFARQAAFAAMFRDEARLSSRIVHPNVVAPIDVVETDDELLVVFEYVHGESLARLLKLRRKGAGAPPPLAIASAIGIALLRGLHAAHVASAPGGEPLGIIHRDVSPENVLVGADGVARLIDFGVAKANGRLAETRTGVLKGKLAYMAPELLRGRAATPATDIYSAGVVLWEALTGRRLFTGETEGDLVERVLVGLVDPPSKYVERAPEELDQLVLRALGHDPEERFATAGEMADALYAAVAPATAAEITAWVETAAAEALARRAETIAAIERAAAVQTKPVAAPGSRSLRRFALVAIVAAAGVGGASAFALTRASPVAATPSAADPAPTEAATPAPSPETPPTTEPPRDEPTSVAARPRRGTPRGPSRAGPEAKSADCAVPYKLDPLGRKVFKRECL
jgi:serine/threonine-protein kinase